MYGRTSKQMTKAYKALEKNKKAKARKKAAEKLVTVTKMLKRKTSFKDLNKRFAKAKKIDPKRKLKKSEERNPGKDRLEVLRKIQARQQARRMDPDNFFTVKKEKKLSRRPQRKLSR